MCIKGNQSECWSLWIHIYNLYAESMKTSKSLANELHGYPQLTHGYTSVVFISIPRWSRGPRSKPIYTNTNKAIEDARKDVIQSTRLYKYIVK